MLKKDFKQTKTRNLNLGGKIHLKVLVVTTFISAFLIFAQLVFANNLALDGQKLSKIEQEIDNFEAENTTLKVQIANDSSFVTLSKKAVQLGFGKPSKITVF